MNRTLAAVLALALALAGSLVLPSVAAPPGERATDRAGAGVVLAPAAGPNGDYASLRGGDLVVDLRSGDGSGLNADAVTTFDAVFSVRYTGSRSATVWLTHDAPGVTFVAGGRPIESPERALRLASDESVAVGVRVDTAVSQSVVDDVTVHSRVADTPFVPSLGPNAQTDVVSETERRLTVGRATAGEPVRLDAAALVVADAGDDNVTLDEVSVTTGENGSLFLDVSRVPPLDAGPLPEDAGAEALGAVRVDGGETVASATLRFSVAPAYLDAVNATPDDLTLYRHSDGAWSELDFEVVGERDGRVRLVAETPGFSTFVVAAERPADADPATPEAAPTDATDGDGAATPSGDDPADADGPPPADAPSDRRPPVAEPAGVDLSAVVGVLVMLALVVAALTLARRVPR